DLEKFYDSSNAEQRKLHINCVVGLDSSITLMADSGTKRTSLVALHMSAIGGKADMALASQNVR
ncbi:MAG: hypothetical protein WA679_22525, partial [Pseudolabrys sp.]